MIIDELIGTEWFDSASRRYIVTSWTISARNDKRTTYIWLRDAIRLRDAISDSLNIDTYITCLREVMQRGEENFTSKPKNLARSREKSKISRIYLFLQVYYYMYFLFDIPPLASLWRSYDRWVEKFCKRSRLHRNGALFYIRFRHDLTIDPFLCGQINASFKWSVGNVILSGLKWRRDYHYVILLHWLYLLSS